jgi:hypothetical protein
MNNMRSKKLNFMKTKYIIMAWILSIVLSGFVGNAVNFLIIPQNQGSQEFKTIYFAPYVNTTHPCYNHGVSCTAELNNVDVTYIVASGDGSVLIENITATESNGFFELSLQAQKSYQISLSISINNTTYYGYTTFNTYQDGANCITTAKMFV